MLAMLTPQECVFASVAAVADMLHALSRAVNMMTSSLVRSLASYICRAET